MHVIFWSEYSLSSSLLTSSSLSDGVPFILFIHSSCRLIWLNCSLGLIGLEGEALISLRLSPPSLDPPLVPGRELVLRVTWTAPPAVTGLAAGLWCSWYPGGTGMGK